MTAVRVHYSKWPKMAAAVEDARANMDAGELLSADEVCALVWFLTGDVPSVPGCALRQGGYGFACDCEAAGGRPSYYPLTTLFGKGNVWTAANPAIRSLIDLLADEGLQRDCRRAAYGETDREPPPGPDVPTLERLRRAREVLQAGAFSPLVKNVAGVEPTEIDAERMAQVRREMDARAGTADAQLQAARQAAGKQVKNGAEA